MAGQPEFDLVAALAFPLPAYMVFALMGVPEADYPQLKRRSHRQPRPGQTSVRHRGLAAPVAG